jgi:hypothetical protein
VHHDRECHSIAKELIMEGTTNTAAGPIEARTVDAGRGVAWWTEAWALFMRSALLWVVLAVILVVAFTLIGMVPLLGSLATALLTPVFFASWLVAARKVEGGGTLELGDLFTCFQGERLKPLMVLGALFAAATLVALLVAGLLGAGAMFGLSGTMRGGMHQGAGGMMAAMGAGLLGLLVFLLFGLIATAALWFAPALVVFRNVAPVEAVMASLRAVFKNVLPFLVYGVIQFVLAIVASIPFGLGWLVLLPVMLLTAYVSYRDVFGEIAVAAT